MGAQSTKIFFRFAILCGIALYSTFALALSPVRSLLKENRLDEAVTMCRQFEVLSTIDNDNYIACAWVYFRSDRDESGQKLLAQVKRVNSVETRLLEAYAMMKGKNYTGARNIISELERQTKGTPVYLDVQELSAELYELNGQLDTAAFIYKLTVSDDRGRGRAHWGLARHYLKVGDTGRAIKHLEDTAKAWPKHIASRYNLGVLYLDRGDLAHAAKWLTAAYEMNSADFGVLEGLGRLFEQKGQIANAMKYWKKAIKVNKDAKVAKEKLAQHLEQYIDKAIAAEKFDLGMKYVHTLEGLGIESPKLLLQRGILHRMTRDYTKAAGDFQAYLATNPDDSLAHRELAIAYLNLKLLDEAANSVARAITKSPSDGENYAWMGFISEAQGNLEEAKENWKKAIRYMKDPEALRKATRKLASVEQKLKGKQEP